MKILYLAPDALFMPKGASVRIERTLRTYVNLGLEVAAFTPRGEFPSQANGFVHHEVSLSAENFLERMMDFRREAAQWLGKQKADAVQFRSIWEGMAAIEWAERHGAQVIYEPHGFPSVELRSHYPALAGQGRLLDKIVIEENHALRRANWFVTPSRTNARFLAMRGVDLARVAVLPNVVDTGLFTPAPIPPSPGPPFRVVYTGTLAPWQGLVALVEALVPFKNRESLSLHIIGPAKRPWRHELRRLSRRLRVHRMIHLSRPMSQRDLVPVLQTAHVAVAPLSDDARNEIQGCCPLKILEFMACGCPILSTRTSSVLEILEHDVNAHLVRPGSPTAIAEGLERLLEDPEARKTLGARAREDALGKWPVNGFVSRLEGFVDRALRS